MSVDAILLGILAIGDLLLLGYLRYRRFEQTRNQTRNERLMRSLAFAVRLENGELSTPEPQHTLADFATPAAR
jgi:hypothetical protein